MAEAPLFPFLTEREHIKARLAAIHRRHNRTPKRREWNRKYQAKRRAEGKTQVVQARGQKRYIASPKGRAKYNALQRKRHAAKRKRVPAWADMGKIRRCTEWQLRCQCGTELFTTSTTSYRCRARTFPVCMYTKIFRSSPDPPTVANKRGGIADGHRP